MENVAFECELLRALLMPQLKTGRKAIQLKGSAERKVTEVGKHALAGGTEEHEQKRRIGPDRGDPSVPH